MCSLNYSISGLVEIRNEDDFDIEGGLEVLPELGNEGVAIVGAGRAWQAMPTDPAMEKGVAT